MEAEAVVQHESRAGALLPSDGLADLYRQEYAPMVRLAHLVTSGPVRRWPATRSAGPLSTLATSPAPPPTGTGLETGPWSSR